MASRFLGAVRSGGIVRRSTTQWDEDGLQTLADAPPITSSILAVPAPEPEKERLFGGVLGNKISSISLRTLKDKLRVPLLTHPEPHVTVHSLFIEFVHDRAMRKPGYTTIEAKVDLQDPQALMSAGNKPLLTIVGKAAGRYHVGYIYTVHYGERSINFCYKVLSPNPQRGYSTQMMGEHLVSPTRLFKEAIPLTQITENRISSVGRDHATPGKYIIACHLISTQARKYSKDRQRLGEITWMIEIM